MDSRRLFSAVGQASNVQQQINEIRTASEQCYVRMLEPGVTEANDFQLVWEGKAKKEFEELWSGWVDQRKNYLNLLDEIITGLTGVQNALQAAADRKYAEENPPPQLP